MDISSINNVAQHPGTPMEPGYLPQPVTQDQRGLIQALKAVNSSELFGEENELTFIVDRATRRMVVRIVNRNSGEVVDQIPAEYVLRMAEELKRS